MAGFNPTQRVTRPRHILSVEQEEEDTQFNLPAPFLTHTLHQKESSVLSLAADARHIFSGSQGKNIYVWDRTTLQVATTLKGHSGSVLALDISEEKEWLFSSAGDSTVRIWCTVQLTPLYIITPHGDMDVGDIFSLAYCSTLSTLFFGCQSTSLQWLDLSDPDSVDRKSIHGIDGESPRKYHKFFDSLPRGASGSLTPNHTPPHGLDTQGGTIRRTDSRSSISSQSQFLTTSSSAPTSTLPMPIPTLPKSSLLFSSQVALNDLDTLSRPSSTSPPSPILCPPRALQVPPSTVIDSAHYGYVYCMAVVPGSPPVRSLPHLRPPGSSNEDVPETVQLVTGSGDEDVKLWSIPHPRSSRSSKQFSQFPKLEHTFSASHGGVLSVIVRHGCIYAGCQDGYVQVWDLETRSLVRELFTKQNVDVLSLSMIGDDLYTCLSDGCIQRWSGSFVRTASWQGHDGIALSSITGRVRTLSSPEQSWPSKDKQSASPVEEQWLLITGASDNHIKLWAVEKPERSASSEAPVSGLSLITDSASSIPSTHSTAPPCVSNDAMVYALSKFVSIPSVSNSELHREDCRQAAIWLKNHLLQLGADTSVLLAQTQGKNPLVLATFSRSSPSTGKRPRVLFYGHYDIIPASSQGWTNPPFTLTGVNGYLYGRGVTDNKGPILAVASAASDLIAKHALDIDLVFLVEGEEEAGSGGFAEVVKANKSSIGEIDAILVSNSYWIGEDTPCITYGLRGVVQSTLEISSNHQDLHSGVEGGAVAEPMMDMIRLLASLSDAESRVLIPSFYDNVRPQSRSEQELYQLLSKVTGKDAISLASRWREPSLTVHSVGVSGSNNSTVIPAKVKAQVSVRIVPDQDLDTIISRLETHVTRTFASLKSPNALRTSIDRTADWWLGELDDQWFHALETAVREEWGAQPLRIREGGSIPTIPYLEKEFGCHALHLPMGQSSDQAHLRDERISLNNLCKGKAVVERFFLALSEPDFLRSVKHT